MDDGEATTTTTTATATTTTTKRKRIASPTLSEENPSKFYSNFLFRALITTIFFLFIPTLPSIAPDLFGEPLLTQSWELFHMILVGIAVSYGLFSRRYNHSGGENYRNDNENIPKFDNAHSYVSRLLHVTSVFDDDEVEPSSAFSLSSSSRHDHDHNETKVQAWSSRYHRNEPTMVVLPINNKDDDSKRRTHLSSTVIGDNKPLLLPIRSLKSRVPRENENENEHENENEGFLISSSSARSFRRSRSSGSRKNINIAPRSGSVCGFRNGDCGVYPGSISKSFTDLTSNSTDSSNDTRNGGFYDVRAEEETVVLPSPVSWRSRSARIEMKRVDETETPEHLLLLRSQPDQLLKSLPSRSSQSTSESSPGKRSSSSSSTPSRNSPNKLHSPPPSSCLESHAQRTEDLVRRKSAVSMSFPPSSLPSVPLLKITPNKLDSSDEPFASGGRKGMNSKETESSMETLQRTKYVLPTPGIGKSVRTVRAGESVKKKQLGGEEWSAAGKPVDKSKEDVETPTAEKPSGLVQETTTSVGTSVASWSLDFLDRVEVATDDDSDLEIEEKNNVTRIQSVENENTGIVVASSNDTVDDDGPDVDRKADEFIAKFREQIRLQRIESIKRSTDWAAQKK